MSGDVPPVVTAVMGARLADGVERTPDTIGYSVGALAMVMRAWREQPHRGWLRRELARATGLGERTVELVQRDLEAAGHAERLPTWGVRTHTRQARRWALTAQGREAWKDVVLDARIRERPSHRRAGPRVPRLN